MFTSVLTFGKIFVNSSNFAVTSTYSPSVCPLCRTSMESHHQRLWPLGWLGNRHINHLLRKWPVKMTINIYQCTLSLNSLIIDSDSVAHFKWISVKSMSFCSHTHTLLKLLCSWTTDVDFWLTDCCYHCLFLNNG